MDDFKYFIYTFVLKKKRERWHFFVDKQKWDKIWDLLHLLDNDLNNKCVFHENNGFKEFSKIVKSKNISHGIYIDKDGVVPVHGQLQIQDIKDDSIVVYQKQKIAFYFSHEGYVWICIE
jgi:hypothetical protein